jgi:outer membrane protein TolC
MFPNNSRSSHAWAFTAPVFLLIITLATFTAPAFAQLSQRGPPLNMTLEEFRQKVLARNESVQVKLLEMEVARRKFKGEYGTFEPEFFSSAGSEGNERQNTVQEQQQQLGAQSFSEQNMVYQGGIESLMPLGSRVRLAYTMRDLRNSLQDDPSFFSRGATNGEFQSFFGLSLTQPLFKNGGLAANMAAIRIAALTSDIAFQEYRRQLMLIMSTAEAAYWNLYMAQEQVRFFQQSVATAEKILTDTKARLETGKSAELEVLEAQAGLALRRSKLSEAEQKMLETANRLITLYSSDVTTPDRGLRAVDRPALSSLTTSYYELSRLAWELNPDYLIQKQKVLQEALRLGYARNQTLPEINFKGSIGLNGLGEDISESWDDITKAGYPSWYAGIELRIPLAGSIKARNEYSAARLRQSQALLSLKEIETQMANGLDNSLIKIKSARDSVTNYHAVVDFNQSLLGSAMERMEVGKLEPRKVLEIEQDLLEANNSLLEAMVNYERGVLEAELISGSTLQRRKLDFTRQDLDARTSQLLASRKLDENFYGQVVKEIQNDYEKQARGPGDSAEQKRAREALGAHFSYWPNTNPPPVINPAAADQRALDAVRKKLEELQN